MYKKLALCTLSLFTLTFSTAFCQPYKESSKDLDRSVTLGKKSLLYGSAFIAAGTLAYKFPHLKQRAITTLHNHLEQALHENNLSKARLITEIYSLPKEKPTIARYPGIQKEYKLPAGHLNEKGDYTFINANSFTFKLYDALTQIHPDTGEVYTLSYITNLLKMGANPNYKILEYTPEVEDCISKKSCYLTSNYTRPYLSSPNFWTPLHFAYNTECAKKLLEYGAVVKDEGVIKYHMAQGNPSIAKLLLENSDVRLTYNHTSRDNPLIALTKNNETAFVEFLLTRQEASIINRPDSTGKTALDYAQENKNYKLIRLLQEHGAMPSKA